MRIRTIQKSLLLCESWVSRASLAVRVLIGNKITELDYFRHNYMTVCNFSFQLVKCLDCMSTCAAKYIYINKGACSKLMNQDHACTCKQCSLINESIGTKPQNKLLIQNTNTHKIITLQFDISHYRPHHFTLPSAPQEYNLPPGNIPWGIFWGGHASVAVHMQEYSP